MRLRRIPQADWTPSPGILLSETGTAIVKSEQNLAVMAGPGSGKTELLAQRASYLLQTGGCPAPRRILAISFKVDAAANLRSRVQQRCGDDLARRFTSLTFDAFAKSMLDRFRMALEESWRPSPDYEVSFPRRMDWEAFLATLAEDQPDRTISRSLRSVDPGVLERQHAPLLPTDTRLTEIVGGSALRIARTGWWITSLAGRSRLTFSMIRRLAQLILKTNPEILRMLHLTYSHVFLDEFQDTTNDQYDVLKHGFFGSDSILTAVGDVRQAIMGWAGAKPKIFEDFERDFAGSAIPLLVNHRSNRAIVDLINAFRSSLWKDAKPIECARYEDAIPELPTGRREFKRQEDEAVFVADLIGREVGAEEHKPEDFALLVRVYANNVEERLKEAFAERNLLLRNDARILEQFSIQDLVKEALFDYLMSLLKLTVHVRSGMPYQTAESFLSDVRGTDLQDARQAKGIQDEMRVAVAATREAIGQSVPQETDFARLCAALHGSIPAAAVKNALPSLRADDRYGAYLASFDQFMRENIDRAASWPSLIDAMEGRGQVRLMTIHKSKGLEFHTVFFLDLHDGSWFSTGEGEENSFFVALSRARERVFFLNSNIAKGALRLVTFSDALDAAGVPEIQ